MDQHPWVVQAPGDQQVRARFRGHVVVRADVWYGSLHVDPGAGWLAVAALSGAAEGAGLGASS
jgi:hypothetical protein